MNKLCDRIIREGLLKQEDNIMVWEWVKLAKIDSITVVVNYSIWKGEYVILIHAFDVRFVTPSG